jgi:hypothetical protein
VLDSVVGVELLKEVFTSRMRWMSLIVEWNASTNMFYLLKNLLLLIMVIFKIKCNNLIFNEIMVLNASYVCLHTFSLRRESPDPDPGRQIPHFWGGSVTQPPYGVITSAPPTCLPIRFFMPVPNILKSTTTSFMNELPRNYLIFGLFLLTIKWLTGSWRLSRATSCTHFISTLTHLDWLGLRGWGVR